MFLLKFYNIILIIIRSFIPLYLRYRLLVNKEDKLRIKERYGLSDCVRPACDKLIWFHASSVGETISILPLVNKIIKENKKIYIIITTCTLTSAIFLKSKIDSEIRIMHQFIPIDFPKYIFRFLNHWRPSLAINVESEIWPNQILCTKKNKIPMILLNARLSNKSFKIWKKLDKLAFFLFSKFDIILPQSIDNYRKFEQLIDHKQKNAKTELIFIGNLKNEVEKSVSNDIELKYLQQKLSNRKVLLALSTHPGEERIIIDAHKILEKSYPDLLTIIMPRHPHRRPKIEKILNDKSIHNYGLRSKHQSINNDENIYIVDTIGEVGLFCCLSDIVVVCGSFFPNIGGHNPLEPARANCALLVGPYTDNFQDIYSQLEATKAVITIQHDFDKANTDYAHIDYAEKLSFQLNNLLSNPDMLKSLQKSSAKFVKEQKKIVNSIYKIIQSKIIN